MKDRHTTYKVIENRRIGINTMLMMLQGETAGFSTPGQFINIEVPGFSLRRPISVFDIEDDLITIVYDVVGKGTQQLAEIEPDSTLNILPALGNGFDLSHCGQRPVLLGGGIGCAPLYSLAKALLALDILPTIILGFNDENRMMLIEQFENLDVPFYVATLDGSYGSKGYVTDVIVNEGLNPDYFYACGPLAMLRAVCNKLDIQGQVSLEARMGCGFGACMCCSLETKRGPKRICKEGPVFFMDDLIWK